MGDLEAHLRQVLQGVGYRDSVLGPPIHGMGIGFEEAPLPPGHAFFHGEKAAPPLPANVVLAVGNCGLYAGPWGERVKDTIVIGEGGAEVLTEYSRMPGRTCDL